MRQLRLVEKAFPVRLQYLRDELREIIQAPEFREMLASGRYVSPEFTLIDAIFAVEEAMKNYENYQQHKQQLQKEAETIIPF